MADSVLSLLNWRTLLQGSVLAILGRIIVKTIYNIYFHPLAAFPGPISRKATRIPWTLSMLNNKSVYDITDLHRKYGPVVRIAPEELSIQDLHGWRDIMGGGNNDIPKWGGMYGVPTFLPPHLQNTTNKEHHRILRKALAPGFSESSLRAQEPLLQKYITALITRLRADARAAAASSGDGGGGGDLVCDLEVWYRSIVFDIICDLALGESLDCINGDGTLHPWIRGIEGAGNSMRALVAVNMYPAIAATIDFLLGTTARKASRLHANHIKPAVQRRLKAGGDARPDLLNPLILLQEKEKKIQAETPSVTRIDEESALDELVVNAQVIIGAGSETTATTLTAATSLLLDNPAALARLQREVRELFATEQDITADAVTKNAAYLNACIDETMRLFPVTGAPSMRKTDRVTTIGSTVVPKDTIVGIWTWTLFRSPDFWTDGDDFHPERWLGEDARYASDHREVFKPYFTGSRDCIGQNLAALELRLILARMIYNFDFAYTDEASREWTKNQTHAFIVWTKTPLNVRLTPR